MGVSQGTAILVMFILCGVTVLGWGLRAGAEWFFNKIGAKDREK